MYVTKHSCSLVFAIMMSATPLYAQGWDGAYVGVHVGAVTADFSNHIATRPGPSGSDASGVAGIQIGYNWQSGNSVVGAEADVSLTDISDHFAAGTFEEDLMTSLRLRAGVTHGATLIFGSVGVAWVEQHSTIAGSGSSTEYEPGLVLGAGAERFLWENVSGRVEAYYVDSPTELRSAGTTPTADGSENLIFRAGLSLHF